MATIPKDYRIAIDRWLQDTENSRPWISDPSVLVVAERGQLVEDCAEYLRSVGQEVFEVRAAALPGGRLRESQLPESVRNTVLLVRGMNHVPESVQQSIWSDWLNLVRPGTGLRFALSFAPFETDDAVPEPEHDLWAKLRSLGTGFLGSRGMAAPGTSIAGSSE